jgi:para-nitrobenzyl esterase
MTVEVDTTYGRLRGTEAEVLAFHGVPYARADRFVAPSAPDPWNSVRSAEHPGPAAPQLPSDDAPVPGMAVSSIGEDCLNLEIRTPRLDGRRPVLVWIPGGSYKIGGNALATYDGTRLAADGDLVVVGVNYRLGACGFLSADGVPSNLGLRDLIAALEWTQAEIAAFGGDPERVTIMGESAGAGAIAHLLAVPGIESLVSGAIIASGAPGATLSAAAAATVTTALLDAAGLADVDALRSIPIDELLAAQASADEQLLFTVGMMPFHPWVDDDLLVAGPLERARAGELAPVPIVVGTTQDEMELFRSAVPDLPAEFAHSFIAPKLEAALGRTASEADVAAGLAAAGDLVEAIADTELHLPASLLADAHSARGLPVWRYRFDWKAPDIGAAHATDLPFHFGTLDTETWREFLAADGEADMLSTRMRAAWAAFCHEGVPSCEPIGEWPRHDTTTRSAIRLGRSLTIEHDPGGERRRAWTGTGA